MPYSSICSCSCSHCRHHNNDSAPLLLCKTYHIHIHILLLRLSYSLFLPPSLFAHPRAHHSQSVIPTVTSVTVVAQFDTYLPNSAPNIHPPHSATHPPVAHPNPPPAPQFYHDSQNRIPLQANLSLQPPQLPNRPLPLPHLHPHFRPSHHLPGPRTHATRIHAPLATGNRSR